MFGIILNTVAVLLGGFFGISLRKVISSKVMDAVFLIVAVTIAIIGIQGAVKGEDMAFVLICTALGGLIGESIDIDKRIENTTAFIKSKMKDADNEFFTRAIEIFLIQCTGSLAILGPLNAGLQGNMDILFFKATLDFTSSIIFASMYGKSIYLSGILLFLYQGGIFALSTWLKPLLTEQVISQLSVVGSVLIFAMALDTLEIKKIKVVNYLPALLIPVVWYGVQLLF